MGEGRQPSLGQGSGLRCPLLSPPGFYSPGFPEMETEGVVCLLQDWGECGHLRVFFSSSSLRGSKGASKYYADKGLFRKRTCLGAVIWRKVSRVCRLTGCLSSRSAGFSFKVHSTRAKAAEESLSSANTETGGWTWHPTSLIPKRGRRARV